MTAMLRFTGHADLEKYRDHLERGLYRAPVHQYAFTYKSGKPQSKRKEVPPG
jgi:hypothetical protein